MINQNKQTQSAKSAISGSQRNYNEVVEFLDARWSEQRTEKNLAIAKALDKALGYPGKSVQTVLVAGTNGKGLTINFAASLLKEEGLKVGGFYSPHVLTYNERISLNNETISNKTFTEIANEVINAAAMNDIKADSLDILTMIALLYFKQQQVDLAICELSDSSLNHPLSLTNPQILAITRVTQDSSTIVDEKILEQEVLNLMKFVKETTYVVSADQSKAHLQLMLDETKRIGAQWSMPIRKLAPLRYPFEQLFGRCAALAERIAQIHIDHFVNKNSLIAENSLLAKQKGQRGRPTLEKKRFDELNPRRTIEQFWKETNATLPAHFEILDKEKPTILLDNARNIDALKNLLLGIRLLHYQRPLKGLTFIFGCDKNRLHVDEFLRLLRYFSKKNSANVIFCPISHSVPGVQTESWDVEQITNDVKSLKIKARSAKNFEEAFDSAKKSVDERHGLVVITGSPSIIAEYWHHKGIKKISQ
jgi:dihydrofolate synthase/folylpolyglutamate synthase